MAKGRGNADFSAFTRRILASRVAWRCSVPGCEIVTIGPGDGPSETADVGTAAHIRSASLRGPRGRSNLSDNELASADNGIWCCATHGREIDTNQGRGYSVEALKEWKEVRENASQRERAGIFNNNGWVNSISITRSPLFSPGATLILDKGTVLQSDGPTGKTALLEWIAAVAG